MKWTQADQDAAYAEGWALFNYPENTDLQKDDDADDFPTDDEATLHVIDCAHGGSPLHQRALDEWKRTNPEGFAEAMKAMGVLI